MRKTENSMITLNIGKIKLRAVSYDTVLDLFFEIKNWLTNAVQRAYQRFIFGNASAGDPDRYNAQQQ